jgi:hypothetical protein
LIIFARIFSYNWSIIRFNMRIIDITYNFIFLFEYNEFDSYSICTKTYISKYITEKTTRMTNWKFRELPRAPFYHLCRLQATLPMMIHHYWILTHNNFIQYNFGYFSFWLFHRSLLGWLLYISFMLISYTSRHSLATISKYDNRSIIYLMFPFSHGFF